MGGIDGSIAQKNGQPGGEVEREEEDDDAGNEDGITALGDVDDDEAHEEPDVEEKNDEENENGDEEVVDVF